MTADRGCQDCSWLYEISEQNSCYEEYHKESSPGLVDWPTFSEEVKLELHPSGYAQAIRQRCRAVSGREEGLRELPKCHAVWEKRTREARARDTAGAKECSLAILSLKMSNVTKKGQQCRPRADECDRKAGEHELQVETRLHC